MRGVILPLPNTPSWRGAQLKQKESFTFIIIPVIYLHFQVIVEATKMGSHPASGGYKYRGLVLRDGGWAWG
jgi:hypothetical protein